MSQQKNSISINEHALKREPVPLNHLTCENSPLSKLLAAWDVSSYETTLVVRSEEKRLFSQAINHLFQPLSNKGPVIIYHRGAEDFSGNHLIFRRTKRWISRN